MSVNSLDCAFSLGVQSAYDVAATAYATALSTVSMGDVQFDTRQPLKEHPGSSGGIPWDIKTPTPRTGYLAPFNNTFLLRPRCIGKVLRGFAGVTSVSNATHHTHTFTPSTNLNLAWLTALVQYVGATNFEQKLRNCRLKRLSIEATDQIQCQMEGVGLVESDSLGSETKVAEVATEMSPYAGSLTLNILSTAITASIRGASVEVVQTFDENDRVLFTTTRAGLERNNIAISGTIRGIDEDSGTYQLYKLLKRGSTVATAPTLNPAIGNAVLTFQSLTNIAGAAVPYSLAMTFSSLEFTSDAPSRQDDQIVRRDIGFKVIGDAAPAVSFVLVNDQSAV